MSATVTTQTGTPITKPIIFFDGVCGMCNTFVNVILKADKKRTFLFAPLQGETASRLLPPLAEDPKEWSLIYLDETGQHEQSDASLEIYKRLGGLWSLLGVAQILPKGIRTPVYRMIAENRYKVFGKSQTCRIPTAEERARFLP